MIRSFLSPSLSFALILATFGITNAQVPGEIYSACTTAGNPLDPNADGFISTTTSGFPVILTDESEDFEGEGWNVVWHLEGEATGDTETGGTCNATEIVDNPNTNEHAAYFRLVDPDNDPTNRNEQLVFRMRIAKHPQGAYGYSMLLDTDLQFGSGADADPNAVSGNPGFELELIYGSGNSNGVGVYNVDGTTNGTAIVEYSQNERNQLAYAKYSNCGGEPVFIDFYVDIATFPAGVDATTPLRIVFASASSPSSALGGSASDIGGVNDSTYPDDDLAFTTAVTNTPISTLETGQLPAVECNDPTACNYDAAATTDTACTYATMWYADTDNDGAGDPNTTQSACTQPAGYVSTAGDHCPSDSNKTEPGLCGCGNVDTDVDSDGVCDDSDLCTDVTACNYDDAGNAACTYATTWYADQDGDGVGDANTTQSACTAPAGYVAGPGDQCPTDASKILPGDCGCGTADLDVDSDGISDCDDNCTNVTACNFDDAGNAACFFAGTWYVDSDGDGYGDPDLTTTACLQPAGYVANSSDLCDNDGSKTDPGLCGCGNVDVDVDSDGVCDTDDNCTDVTACNFDDAGNAACFFAGTWYVDSDGDGYGDPDLTTTACLQPAGYVANSSDLCDNDGSKTDPGLCGCGNEDVDIDSDGVCDTDDNCTDVTACNFDDAGNAACFFAGTWYVDSDGDGYGDPDLTTTACLQPAGYVANSSDLCDNDGSKTDPGLCGCGNVDVDVDSDGVCDTDDNCTDVTACNFDDAGNASCTFATTWYADGDGDGFGDSETTLSACTQPEGYVADSSDQCDDDANKTEPGVCGCGNVDVDVDSDSVCDTDDNCTDVTANNYNSESNAVCSYNAPSGPDSEVADRVEACNGDDDVTLNLDNLHSFGPGATYGISSNLSGFATGTLNGSNLTLDFSGEGVGSDTLFVSVQTEGTFTLKIPVSEYGYPYLIEDISVEVASSPRAFDGAILADFANTYGQPITVHLLPFGTLQLVNGVISVPHNRYTIQGFTNSKGCYNPAPATTQTPTPNPTPRRVVVPCLRCSHQ